MKRKTTDKTIFLDTKLTFNTVCLVQTNSLLIISQTVLHKNYIYTTVIMCLHLSTYCSTNLLGMIDLQKLVQKC